CRLGLETLNPLGVLVVLRDEPLEVERGLRPDLRRTVVGDRSHAGRSTSGCAQGSQGCQHRGQQTWRNLHGRDPLRPENRRTEKAPFGGAAGIIGLVLAVSTKPVRGTKTEMISRRDAHLSPCCRKGQARSHGGMFQFFLSARSGLNLRGTAPGNRNPCRWWQDRPRTTSVHNPRPRTPNPSLARPWRN